MNVERITLPRRLPELPDSIATATLRTPTLGERREGIDVLLEAVGVKRPKTIETRDAVIFAGTAGEVQFFPAGGGLAARNRTVSQGFDDETRDWPGVRRTETRSGVVFRLDDETARYLADRSRRLIRSAGLLTDSSVDVDVALDQWAQLDESGKQIAHGAGSAAVQYRHQLDGVRIAGAGAKSTVRFDPVDGQPRLQTMFHAWRPPTSVFDVRLPGIDETIELTVMSDRHLLEALEGGQRVAIQHLELVLYAMPVLERQSALMPALEVHGSFTYEGGREPAHFARHYPLIDAATMSKHAPVPAALVRS